MIEKTEMADWSPGGEGGLKMCDRDNQLGRKLEDEGGGGKGGGARGKDGWGISARQAEFD